MHSCFSSYYIFINISIEFDYIPMTKVRGFTANIIIFNDWKRIISLNYNNSENIPEVSYWRKNNFLDYNSFENLFYDVKCGNKVISD